MHSHPLTQISLSWRNLIGSSVQKTGTARAGRDFLRLIKVARAGSSVHFSKKMIRHAPISSQCGRHDFRSRHPLRTWLICAKECDALAGPPINGHSGRETLRTVILVSHSNFNRRSGHRCHNWGTVGEKPFVSD